MDLYLTKGGYISIKDWVYDEETEKGGYEFERLKDYEPNILNYIQYNVELEKGFTCRDLLELVLRYPSLQFLDLFWEDFLSAYKSCPKESCVSDDIDYIRIQKYVESTIYKDRELDDCIVWTALDAPKDDDIPYSLGFMPLKDFIDHELKLDELTIIQDNHNIPVKERLEYCKKNKPEKWRTNYTLCEVLHCFIFDISFYGTPEDTEKTKGEILEMQESIENGTAELIELDLNDIDKHFDNISDEELTKNIKEAGGEDG